MPEVEETTRIGSKANPEFHQASPSGNLLGVWLPEKWAKLLQERYCPIYLHAKLQWQPIYEVYCRLQNLHFAGYKLVYHKGYKKVNALVPEHK